MDELQKGDFVYYARIFKPPLCEYEIIELKVNCINNELKYFTGCEVSKSKQTFIFNFCDWDKCVFADRNVALNLVKEAEKKFGKATRQKEIVLEDD